MHIRKSISVFVVTLMAVGTTYVFSATQSALPKYDGSGALVDSSIYDVGGNVGIGTAAPGQRLHVAGGMTYLTPSSAGPGQGLQLDTAALANGSNGVYINAPEGWSGSYFKANMAGVEQFAFFHNGNGWLRGNLGVGTNVPNSRIHMLGGMMYLQPTAGGPNQGLRVDTAGLPNGSNALFVNAPAGWTGNSFKANVDGAETFAIAANGGAWFNGNVGVGTSSPSAKLHVNGGAIINGDIAVNGSLSAKFQDVAEWVDASETADAGTVMIADHIEENHVRPSSRAYDTAVAGVVSPQPGVLLGEAGAGKVIVAQSGRVRVKVDATYGAVKPGDLLVTSPRPGYAMRSETLSIGGASIHRPGTILGKALGTLESGEGEVLSLLTLQ
jgi:hypothetical protein